MSVENPLWGAHGELLKLGFAFAQSNQGWRTFLRNRAFEVAAMDLLVVPTIGLWSLYAFTVARGVEWTGIIVCRPILGGLHHQYGRM